MPKNVRDIVKAAGGPAKVGRAVGLSRGVVQWYRIGIPDRYWAVLLGLVPGLTTDELYAANLAARSSPVDGEAPRIEPFGAGGEGAGGNPAGGGVASVSCGLDQSAGRDDGGAHRDLQALRRSVDPVVPHLVSPSSDGGMVDHLDG